MGTVNSAVIVAQKEQWLNVKGSLEKRAVELSGELERLHPQIQQLSGAIQACDVLLNAVAPTNSDTLTAKAAD